MSLWNIFTLQNSEPSYFTKDAKKMNPQDNHSLVQSLNEETVQKKNIMYQDEDQIDQVLDPYDSQITLNDLQTHVVKHYNKIPEEQKRKWSSCSQEQAILEECVQFSQKLVNRSFKSEIADCSGVKNKFNECRKLHDLL